MKLLLIVSAALLAFTSASSDHSDWIRFKAQHSKNYNLIDDKFRFNIFQNNLRKIEEHNARYEKGETSYYLKITSFSDWTEEEFLSLLNRQSSSKPRFSKNYGTFSADPNIEIPESIDWREKNAVTDVKNQGSCGACWTFSTVGAVEGQLAIHQNKLISLSAQELLECDRQNDACMGGFQEVAFEYIAHNGISSDVDYPYNGRWYRCQTQHERVIEGLSGIIVVEKDEESLAAAIASVGPISVSFDAGLLSQYGGGIFDSDKCSNYTDHAILGVGYTPDYWILKNSWGEDWGEKGYFRVKRGKKLCGIDTDNSYPIL